MIKQKSVYMRCDDHAECAVLTRTDYGDGDTAYEFSIEDSYCGGDYMGIKGRFKRALKAFLAKPICFSAVYCEDGERMKKFLEECLQVMGGDE